MNREGQGKIGYLDFVWNPVVGCTHGCPWCWARRQAKRQKHNCPKCYAFTPHLHPKRLDEPLRKREPSVIGVAFMGDLFDPEINGEIVARCFEVMQACPRHTFVVLTKQAKRMRAECETLFENWFVRFPNGILPNVVLGVSVEDQASADRLIPELLACPATKRIVSIEPMRGPVDLVGCLRGIRARGYEGAIKLDGVILGGQTGPGAVPMHPDWVRKVRDQCQEAGVPFFFKQWGEWGLYEALKSVELVKKGSIGPSQLRHAPASGEILEVGKGLLRGWHEPPHPLLTRFGRRRLNRVLDGRTHDEVAWTANAETGTRKPEGRYREGL